MTYQYNPAAYHPNPNILLYRVAKRLFDILVASILIVVLLPLFLLVALLIKLESRGPVIYSSTRVGEGFKTFGFFKFRTMRTDADQLLEKMKQLNHYGATAAPAPPNNSFSWEKRTDDYLVADEGLIAQTDWAQNQGAEQSKAFVKFKNDPRITRVGRFLRNTSIDELPQLFNVLLGDMSLVGNRPLPMYEAYQLTTDEAIGRFLAPAGMTGLWQVTERGKTNTTAESRKQLDVAYSQNLSFWLDLQILFKTPLAAIQQENV